MGERNHIPRPKLGVRRIEQESPVKYRLPEHPLSGLLNSVLIKNRLDFLFQVAPDDLYQEAAIFLLAWDNEEPTQEFMREAAKHFYHFAKDYGYKKGRSYTGYRNTEVSGILGRNQEGEFEEDAREMLLNPDKQPDAQSWFTKAVRYCESSCTPEQWNLLRSYLLGYGLEDIAKLQGRSAEELQEDIFAIIDGLRTELGVSLDLPVPAFRDRSLTIHQQYSGAERAVNNRQKERVPVGMSQDALHALSLETLMDMFGISRATAHRLRKRGWYVPGYHDNSDKE